MGSSKETTEMKPTKEDQAIRDVITRFLFDMISQGPDTFARFSREGPRPYPPLSLTSREGHTLGYSRDLQGLSPQVQMGMQRRQQPMPMSSTGMVGGLLQSPMLGAGLSGLGPINPLMNKLPWQ